ncbi:Diphosphomevalonate decarboxylase [Echinococcus granulosus]|uniref:Diphosphomevalonate decarboxylase n=1 Tax=Echinococcus granulosus TaxID=6210 RepID=A0A068WI84_ECHGR|nr:Diphosphomevalonate decarboxylase [Echinococcus granulosus]CDS18177.1 diphosphomevalonate decarboxylase [Echinococcus granulosus]
MSMVEVIAPVNIALLKYWGKSDYLNIEPITDSLSLTLNSKQLYSLTQISLSPGVEQTFTLNEKHQNLTNRMKDVIIASQLRAMQKGSFRRFQKLHIRSTNNFPTAAGLASSASGLASLAFGLSTLYHLEEDIAALARRGSGSACRSMYGGVVHWKRSATDDKHSSSSVEQLFPHTHWPELRVLICVTSSHRKPVSSSEAMRRTVATSPLFQEARATVVDQRLPRFIDAFGRRDFAALAELTMRESNELHAFCLDSWPPAIYLNSTSFAIMDFVHALNQHMRRCVVAYTFDAGPNAFLLTLADDAPLVLSLLAECFGQVEVGNGEGLRCYGDDLDIKRARFETQARRLEVRGIQYSLEVDLDNHREVLRSLPRCAGSIQYILSTEANWTRTTGTIKNDVKN